MNQRQGAAETIHGEVSPFDYRSLLEQWNGKTEFVARILQTFDREARKDIEKLKTALNTHDHALVAELAHRMKGAAATIGAEFIREQAARLEAVGRTRDLESAPPMLASLISEYERYARHASALIAFGT